ncbi:MAG: substrate-binding periplasmic protein [Cellvibrionaceae bacterium]
MREFVRWLSLIVYCCAFSGAAVAEDASLFQEPRLLTYFVIEQQAQPLQIEDEDKPHSGIVSDIVLQIANDLSLPIEVVVLPFKRMVLEMKKPKNRNWLAYGSPAWRKDSSVSVQSNCLLPQPILNVTHSLITRSDDQLAIDSVEKLFGQRVITLHGYSYPVLADYFSQGAIHKLDVKSLQSAFKAVAAKRGVGFVGMDIRVLHSFASGELSRADFRFYDLSFLIPEYPIHLSYDCNMDTDLRMAIAKRYGELIDDGSVVSVLEKYLSPAN